MRVNYFPPSGTNNSGPPDIIITLSFFWFDMDKLSATVNLELTVVSTFKNIFEKTTITLEVDMNFHLPKNSSQYSSIYLHG